jgi:predicted metal-binding membrane protein
MVGAMMLPTIVPMVRLVFTVSATVPDRRRVRSALLGAYGTTWLGFGLLVLAGDTGLHRTVDAWPWLDAHAGLVKAGLLGLAGAAQFSSVKERCLTACRDPMTMLWQHYGRGTAKAWKLGWAHAMSCLGCCWALMLLMFGVGVGSLAWMLALTAVMVAEKTTRWGRHVVQPVGMVLIGLAVAYGLATFGVGPFDGVLTPGPA